jgi:hypothetical protein
LEHFLQVQANQGLVLSNENPSRRRSRHTPERNEDS